MRLTTKITLAVLLGIAAGSFFPEAGPYFKRGAEVFLSLVNMIVVLLVLSTVALGIVHFKTPSTLFHVARRSFALFITFTALSLLIGMGIAMLFGLGNGLHLTVEQTPALEIPSIGAMVLSWVPANPLASLAEGNIIQIIIFSTFLGVAINAAGHKGRAVTDCLESVYGTMQQITNLVFVLAPFGVFAIVAYAAGYFHTTEWTWTALHFILAYIFGAFIVVVFVYGLALYYLWHLSPWRLIKGMRNALYVAFATRSSTATLPVTMNCLTQNLGVSRDIAGFVAPMGATLNMNGLALFHGMAAIFVAQAYDITLGMQGFLAIIVSAALSAIRTGGIPGAGLIQLYAVFNSVGLPIEGIALIAVFETIREMVSSMLNVLGDAVSAAAVAQTFDSLDERIYVHGNINEWESSVI